MRGSFLLSCHLGKLRICQMRQVEPRVIVMTKSASFVYCIDILYTCTHKFILYTCTQEDFLYPLMTLAKKPKSIVFRITGSLKTSKTAVCTGFGRRKGCDPSM